ncbi:hypothetical protein MK079_04790 [Candidatus Gracilibacteria bacterium]|nr:hypothetical protein [Candidatus Gracilibacteria bacterium]
MGWKDVIKKSLSDKKIMNQYVLKAARFVLSVSVFLFFLHVFFVITGFYADIFLVTFLYIFFLTLLSFALYGYALVRKYVGSPWDIISGIFFVMIALVPFFIANKTFDFILTFLSA